MEQKEIKLLAKEVVKEQAKLVIACLKVFKRTAVGSEANQIASILNDYVQMNTVV